MKISIWHNPDKTVDHDYWEMRVEHGGQIWRDDYHAPETFITCFGKNDPSYTPIKGLSDALEHFALYLKEWDAKGESS